MVKYRVEMFIAVPWQRNTKKSWKQPQTSLIKHYRHKQSYLEKGTLRRVSNRLRWVIRIRVGIRRRTRPSLPGFPSSPLCRIHPWAARWTLRSPWKRDKAVEEFIQFQRAWWLTARVPLLSFQENCMSRFVMSGSATKLGILFLLWRPCGRK